MNPYIASKEYDKVPGNPCSKATASLVLGIIGIIAGGCLWSIIAIILGCSARNTMKKSGTYNSLGVATAGITLGIVSFVSWAVVIILYLSIKFGWF